MKIITCLLTTLIWITFLPNSYAQQIKSYDAEWKKVEQLIKKEYKSRSALEMVNNIYNQAKKDKQEAQVIKALVYKTALQREFTENSTINAIKKVEGEIAGSNKIATAILKSYLASLYWNYFQENRWQLYNRTNTVNFNKQDIATWTVEDFHAKISTLYVQSLQHKESLQATSLKNYDAIIEKGNTRNLRPSLYDLLAYEALSYFSNDERDIKKPSYAFEIEQATAFAPAQKFISTTFKTNDTLSLKHKALQVYQSLLAFHLNDTKKDALVDADIHRVEYVYSNSVHADKDSLYVQALENILEKWGSNPIASQAAYLLAAYYESKASTYNPLGDTTQQYARIKAKEILEKVVQTKHTYTEGWVNSYNLLQSIKEPHFNFEIEAINVPHQPFRSLVKYKNIDTIYFRVVRNTKALKDLSVKNNEKYWEAIIQANALTQWQQALPQTNDLQEHAVEVKVNALPVGEYILIASNNGKLTTPKIKLGAQRFFVSNISYVHERNNYFVLHRQSGQPLNNAKVNVFQPTYDYQTSSSISNFIDSFTTNSKGFFAFNKQTGSNNTRRASFYQLHIYHNQDSLKLDDYIYNYYTNQIEEEEYTEQRVLKNIYFFTDRGLYRPGQTVYFKGIAINSKKSANNIAQNFTTTVYLVNANKEEVDSVKVTTNEFGSFSGTFVLPQNVLNGSFYLSDKKNNGVGSFAVEEYKRPKFFVDFNKITKSYKVNDSIAVTGVVKAYAGYNINNATVSYRVVRQPRFIYPWLFRGWWPQQSPMEITHGQTTTNSDGNFQISFVAIPDKTVSKKFEPLFDYVVYADVTDISGETRSGSYTVTAAYKSLLLQVKLDDRIATDSLLSIRIKPENIAGQFQPARVSITVNKLKAENRLIRERYWQQPDTFVMSKEAYISYFPNDVYKNENVYSNWPVQQQVYQNTDSIINDSAFIISNIKREPGFYEVVVTTQDKEGGEVKSVQYFEWFNPKADTLTKPDYLWVNKINDPVIPGEKATLQIGTSANNVYLVEDIDKQHENDAEKNIQTQSLNNKKTFQFAPTNNDRGGFGVAYFFVKDNRLHRYSQVIQVPWNNKELKIEYQTFRDKTLPGNKEEWKIKISGYQNELVATELLASMYDASLDQFKPFSWQQPSIWPEFAHLYNWTGNNNFQAITSNHHWYNNINYKSFDKQYDQFIFNKYEMQQPMMRMEEVEASRAEDSFKRMINPKALAGKAVGIRTDTVTNNYVAAKPIAPQVEPRKNFNETAFFYPHLQTDKDGTITFSFTTPDALTKWKMQLLAHTKELAMGLSSKEVITQKELMVEPNMPRFLREGDRLEVSTKIVNTSGKEITGQAQLQLIDAETNQSVDGWFQNVFPVQYFTVAAGGSEAMKFPIEIPFGFNKILKWRIIAKGGNYSDGEENMLPVLTNKILVTETLPLPLRGTETKSFTFNKLLNAGQSETLKHHALTVEYTTNPAWYAVQALPYLAETRYENAEQIWNRYYANALAAHIANTSPRIKQIFESWSQSDSAALLSNLQKNEELKSIILQETPWVLQAKTEAEQKRAIALLFNLSKMGTEQERDLKKLAELQSPNGGFVWFKGGPDDRYITQYIVTGIGHLVKLTGTNNLNSQLQQILKPALTYLDKQIQKDYEELVKSKADVSKQHIGYTQVQYLYMRSFFKSHALLSTAQKAYNYYSQQAQQYWMKTNNYMQGMIALALYRNGNNQVPTLITASLKERAVISDEMGMYWKDATFGYAPYWWHAPIETHALLIETFTEIGSQTQVVNNIKTWLIKNKQTNSWTTSKATAEACYALLLQGSDWLTNEPSVQISLGSTVINNSDRKTEEGTGYFKESIKGDFVNPAMGNIKVSVQSTGTTNGVTEMPSWGAVYWQYFEDMDKVTPASTPLKLNKKLFIEQNSDRGPILLPIENKELKPGDKITVRIELTTDRDLQYVHMKDMRASALEPVNVLSGYKWKGGLGYYETTKDVSTSFFFHYLRKGTYVFEYPLFITHTGYFSNGITTVECMYAPEFSAHSEGVKLRVE